MKSNLYLDPTTYDIVLNSSFNLRTTQTYTEWLSQKIENHLKTFLGEWFVDYTIGVPYIQSIFKKIPNITQVNSILLNEIKNVEGVQKIINYEIDFDTELRKYRITNLQVLSQEGQVIDVGTVTT